VEGSGRGIVLELSQHMPGETEENYEQPQDSWSPDRDLNLGPPECKRELPLVASGHGRERRIYRRNRMKRKMVNTKRSGRIYRKGIGVRNNVARKQKKNEQGDKAKEGKRNIKKMINVIYRKHR
jgi:hypothetical protein